MEEVVLLTFLIISPVVTANAQDKWNGTIPAPFKTIFDRRLESTKFKSPMRDSPYGPSTDDVLGKGGLHPWFRPQLCPFDEAKCKLVACFVEHLDIMEGSEGDVSSCYTVHANRSNEIYFHRICDRFNFKFYH